MKLSHRPSAEQCLQLPFFMKYIIPPALSDDVFTEAHVLDRLAATERTSHFNGTYFRWCIIFAISKKKQKISIINQSIFDLTVHSVMVIDDGDDELTQMELCVVYQPKLGYSIENIKYAMALNRVYHRFSDICRYYDVSAWFLSD